MIPFIIDITFVSEAEVLAVRRTVDTHIETDGLDCSGTKLLALGLFVFIERGRWGRCAYLDNFGNEKARLWRRGQCFN